MQLRSSPSSPFGRKVKMATYILGFDDQLKPVLTDTLDPNDSICEVNPLGKIPALEDDGTTYYDSRVIMEYLDAKAGGGKIIPAHGPERYETLTRAALMDGILDAAVLVKNTRRLIKRGQGVYIITSDITFRSRCLKQRVCALVLHHAKLSSAEQAVLQEVMAAHRNISWVTLDYKEFMLQPDPTTPPRLAKLVIYCPFRQWAVHFFPTFWVLILFSVPFFSV